MDKRDIQLQEPDEADWLCGLPKAELHLHLDGCIPVKSAHEMLQEMPHALPYADMSVSRLKQRMVAGGRLASQKELLTYFDIPTLVLQTGEHLRRAYYELCEMKARDRVIYCEVRFAPLLHTDGGLSVDEVMGAVLEGKREGERDFPISTNIIVVGLKDRSPDENIHMLETILHHYPGSISAVDCAGVEADNSILRQRKFLWRAKELGLPVTFHCGEIWDSLDEFEAITSELLPGRIAHGATALHSPSLCQLLRDHQIMLDVCPTSNLQAGLYQRYADIPLRQLKDFGIPFSISTDDTILSDITMSQELGRVSEQLHFSCQELGDIMVQAMIHSFADDRTKESVIQAIQAFLKQDRYQVPSIKS